MKPRQHWRKLSALAALLAVSAQHGSGQTSGLHLTTIYSFTGGSDGASPNSLLITKNGPIYGTAISGGTGLGGTVFELNRPSVAGGSWTETTLYSFKGVPDGYAPTPGLTIAATVTYTALPARAGPIFPKIPPVRVTSMGAEPFSGLLRRSREARGKRAFYTASRLRAQPELHRRAAYFSVTE